MTLTETIVPTDDEQEIARRSSRILSRGGDLKLIAARIQSPLPKSDAKVHVHPKVKIQGRAQALAATVPEEVVMVPARVAHMFQTILEQLAQGKAVTIVPNDALLTTQDAADLLHVSRPFLIKLLEREKVGIQKVGNRRKISFEAIKQLKAKLQSDSEQALRNLAELDRELDLPD
jgi:excisionase family DNA binding protein